MISTGSSRPPLPAHWVALEGSRHSRRWPACSGHEPTTEIIDAAAHPGGDDALDCGSLGRIAGPTPCCRPRQSMLWMQWDNPRAQAIAAMVRQYCSAPTTSGKRGPGGICANRLSRDEVEPRREEDACHGSLSKVTSGAYTGESRDSERSRSGDALIDQKALVEGKLFHSGSKLVERVIAGTLRFRIARVGCPVTRSYISCWSVRPPRADRCRQSRPRRIPRGRQREVLVAFDGERAWRLSNGTPRSATGRTVCHRARIGLSRRTPTAGWPP